MELERRAALEALRAAAGICRAVQAELVDQDTIRKRDRSPVTVADFAAQAAVCRRLAEDFPRDPVVGEESSAVLRAPETAGTQLKVVQHVRRLAPQAEAAQVLEWIDHGGGAPGGRFWTLDPIDGTKGYLRRGQYAIALALIEDGRILLGALACPDYPVDPEQPDGARGILCYAERDAGACWLPLDDAAAVARPLRVESDPDPAAARLVESVEAGHADQGAHGRIARRLGIARPSLRIDSQAKYAAVARGEATIYLRLPSPATPDYRENIWDHAAGVCIVEQAGGTVTDARGRPLDFAQGRKLTENRGVVVSSGPYHGELLRACAEVAPVG